MKGPGNRLRFDVRRVWECPICHRRERTSGEVVNRLCDCLAKKNGQQTSMKLIEENGRRKQRLRTFPNGSEDYCPAARAARSDRSRRCASSGH